MSTERRNTEGLRLFSAVVDLEFYVAARTEEEAELLAGELSLVELMGASTRYAPLLNRIHSVEEVAEEWEGSLPFTFDGHNDAELTYAEIAADQPAPTESELEAAGQARLFDS